MSKINNISFRYMKANDTDTTSTQNYIIGHQPEIIDFDVAIDTVDILQDSWPLQSMQVILYIGDDEKTIQQEVSSYINTLPYTGQLSFMLNGDYSEFSKSTLTFSIQCLITNTVYQSAFINMGSITSQCTNSVHYMSQSGHFQDGIMRVYYEGKWVCGKV